jgi:FkbM family methyltransferase
MSLASQLRQFADRLDTPGAVWAQRRRIPLGIYQFFERVKSKHQIRSILDVGANHGRMASFFAECFPGAAIHVFEPLPGCRIYLEKFARSCPRATIHPVAIGEKSARMEMFENAYDQASSLMPMMERHRELWPETAATTKIVVPVEPLDSLVPGLQVDESFFLKIDTQGYEMNVLKGAVETLRRCAVVMMEVLFEPLYEGQPDFRALLNFMAAHGFRFVEFVEEHRTNGKLVFADAIFENERLT